MQRVPDLAYHPAWTAARRLIRKGYHCMHGYFSRRRSSSFEIAPCQGFQIPAFACLSHQASACNDEGGHPRLFFANQTAGHPRNAKTHLIACLSL